MGFGVKLRQKINAPTLEEAVYLGLDDMLAGLLRVKNPFSVPPDVLRAGHKLIALEVAAVEFLKSKGVKIAWGPVTAGGSKRAEIGDPGVYPIELKQWPGGGIV